MVGIIKNTTNGLQAHNLGLNAIILTDCDLVEINIFLCTRDRDGAILVPAMPSKYYALGRESHTAIGRVLFKGNQDYKDVPTMQYLTNSLYSKSNWNSLRHVVLIKVGKTSFYYYIPKLDESKNIVYEIAYLENVEQAAERAFTD